MIRKSMQFAINGILLLDKPLDLTSNAALQKVKRLFQAKKAGHTGSLDPLATGMLPICFGEATKLSQYLLESDKHYKVKMQLGVKTETGDAEGKIIATKPVNVQRDEIELAIQGFMGQISQIPPMYSAIKMNGRPLYELARKGIEVVREPRTVHIYALRIDEFANDSVSLHVHCSKGTYIRTLIEDIGDVLGCGAHVIGLRRLNVAPYQNCMMHTLPTLEGVFKAEGLAGLKQFLLPLETTVQQYPTVKLSPAAAFYMRTGQPVMVPNPPRDGFVGMFDSDGTFLGVGEMLEDGRIAPRRIFTAKPSVLAG